MVAPAFGRHALVIGRRANDKQRQNASGYQVDILHRLDPRGD
jgi:hypothetical protein